MVKFFLSTLPSMLLIKWPRYKPFPCKLPTISNHAKETFFMESVFTKVKYSGLQGCSVWEKINTFAKILCNLQNFRTLFPDYALPECIFSAIFNLEVGCRLYSCNCIKRKFHYMRFSDNFSKFSTHFKTPSWNHMWRSLVGFWVADNSPVYIKDSKGIIFWNFMWMTLSPQKSLMNSHFGSNQQYF